MSKYVIPDLIGNLLPLVFLNVTLKPEEMVDPESSSGGRNHLTFGKVYRHSYENQNLPILLEP